MSSPKDEVLHSSYLNSVFMNKLALKQVIQV